MKRGCINYELLKKAAVYQHEIKICQNLQRKVEKMNSTSPLPLAYFSINYSLSNILGKSLSNVVKAAVNQTFLTELSGILGIATSINAALWGRVVVNLGEWQEFPVLQSIIVAESGKRKSSLFSWPSKVFMAYQKKLEENFDPHRHPFNKKVLQKMESEIIKKAIRDNLIYDKESVEKLYKENNDFKNLFSDSEKTIHKPQIISSTSTPYGLALDIYRNGGCNFFCSAEPSGCEQIIAQENIELFLKGYTQEMYYRKSGRNTIYIPSPSLNILVASQYPFLKKILISPQLMKQGFLARFLITINSYILENKFEGDEEGCYNQYQEKIFCLLNTFFTRDVNASKHYVEVSEDAKKLLLDFRQEIANAVLTPNVQIWASKLHGQTARIALAIHAWNYGSNLMQYPITAEEMNAAITIAQMIGEQAVFIYDPEQFLAMCNAIKIRESLLRISTPSERASFIRCGTTSTLLQQRTGLKKINILSALYLLENYGWIAIWDNGSGNFKVMPRYDFFGNLLS